MDISNAIDQLEFEIVFLFLWLVSLVTQVLEYFSVHSLVFLHLRPRAFVCGWVIECVNKFTSTHSLAVWPMELTGKIRRWKNRQLGVWALPNIMINLVR